MQAILQYGAEAVSSANEWKGFDYYSKDLQELVSKDKVNVIRTPQDVFDTQIKAWDGLIAQLQQDPFMKKVMDFAEGLGEACGVLYAVECNRLQRRLQPSLPWRIEDVTASAAIAAIAERAASLAPPEIRED